MLLLLGSYPCYIFSWVSEAMAAVCDSVSAGSPSLQWVFTSQAMCGVWQQHRWYCSVGCDLGFVELCYIVIAGMGNLSLLR